MQSEIDPIIQDFERRKGLKEGIQVQKIEYATSFPRQLRFVAQRAIRNLIRNPQATVLQVVIMIVFALLVGLIYFDIDSSYDYGTQNR